MPTWSAILEAQYPQLLVLSHRLAARQAIPWGNRDDLAHDALHDACLSLIEAAEVPNSITNNQAYVRTVLIHALWKVVRQLRARLTDGLDAIEDTMPAPPTAPYDALMAEETLVLAQDAAGHARWPVVAARLRDPAASAIAIAVDLATTPGTVRVALCEARKRIAIALARQCDESRSTADPHRRGSDGSPSHQEREYARASADPRDDGQTAMVSTHMGAGGPTDRAEPLRESHGTPRHSVPLTINEQSTHSFWWSRSDELIGPTELDDRVGYRFQLDSQAG